MRGLKAYDEHAFREMVLLYQGRIYNICYRMLGNPCDAEDLAQETFLRAFRGIQDYQHKAKLGTWLYRIAVNLCKNYLGYRHRRRSASVDDIPERHWRRTSMPMTGAPAPQPDQCYEHDLAQAQIQHALAALTPEAREVLILRDIEGLSYQEIIEVTDLPIGTLKSKLWRARVAFKDAYERVKKVNP
ncbi:sigma-70 family RNA polymerase sigma factor [Myxococcota bacterium]|nr:sigma-70 family RNA polymerase sigma factor [Myxococcota bacterium]MBU1432962.1 sigma-70 family RNA polymerase sigma factor [Myxococcota bacterium]MBU1896316.1 sigma-70 family RNA polymerase sigma factor [Myxococcota bacterium]